MCRSLDSKVTLEDLYIAYTDFRKNKKKKPGTKEFAVNSIDNLLDLRDDINNRTYKLSSSTCFVVNYPVPREVFCAEARDRIVQRFVYNELNPVIEKLIIRDTAACRVGKGTDYAIARCATFLRRATDNYKHIDGVYIKKFDLSGFFMSINRRKLLKKIKYVIHHYYKGKYKSTLLYLAPILILSDVTADCIRLSPLSAWDRIPPNKTLFGNKHGLPIGNITSQLFANFYLNDIDHYIKSRHKYYVRNVDDAVIIDRDLDKIEETMRNVEKMLAKIGLRLNKRKTLTYKAAYGVPFLGVLIKPFYTVVSGKKIKRLWYTSRYYKSAQEMFVSCACRKGMFNRYHGRHLSMRWYDSLPQEYKKTVKMDSDAHFHLCNGDIKTDKTKLKTIYLYSA